MGKLCDEAVLLYRRVVYHGDVDGALRPENLAKAFGLSDSEDTAENALIQVKPRCSGRPEMNV
ncbi:hypothetical protein [Mobiluncus mulieris]|uniref:hypothetical protein n=1 Tax=Mobiluncus mulieris TaxID=2052 RepID=UPI00209348A7|nr:hypothetical protein [Mobiluncus mulieris]